MRVVFNLRVGHSHLITRVAVVSPSQVFVGILALVRVTWPPLPALLHHNVTGLPSLASRWGHCQWFLVQCQLDSLHCEIL